MNNRQLVLVKSVNISRKLCLTKNVFCKIISRVIETWNRAIYAYDIGVTDDIPLPCVFLP